jgi:RNA polymerase sigma factor (sigma-70 family)
MSKQIQRKGLMTALVMGTALSALGAAPAAPPDAGPVARDLSRYCTACWRNARIQPDRWEDCTQEVLTRLLERVEPRKWERLLSSEGEERAEFVRAIDAVKKRTQRARRPASLAGDVADHRTETRDHVEEQRQALLHLARNHLSPRQERIVRHTLDGWTVQQIADQMELPAARVSDEKYKAIQKLRQLV